VTGSDSNPDGRQPTLMVRRELFISYSHRDLKWLEQLRTHLKPLERNYNLERWDDSRIKPGDKWLVEIEQALSRAAVALLLVSPDFVASDFIDRKEMPSLLDAARNQGLEILWVPLRPISLKLFPQIEQYQAVFSPERTLADMTDVEQDRALAKISETILETIDNKKQQEALKQNDNLQRVESDRLELRSSKTGQGEREPATPGSTNSPTSVIAERPNRRRSPTRSCFDPAFR
jgi:hypothetical protein